jgi:hypothetical protein
MNWRTAIFGLLVIYCGVGLIDAWIRSRNGSAQGSMTLWTFLVVVFLFGALLNEWIARRRTSRTPPKSPNS